MASTPARSAPKRPAKQPRRRRGFTLPALGGALSAVVTGILVGVITVGLTWASLRVCEAVRGTSSCGGPGYLLLLGILIAMILLGAALLRAWGVPDPGSTSTLAVGLLAVLVMLFLVGVLFHWWMILVIPACSALTFAAAHWVASTFVTDADLSLPVPQSPTRHFLSQEVTGRRFGSRTAVSAGRAAPRSARC